MTTTFYRHWREAPGGRLALAEFRRRIKTQTVLPEADSAPMLFWALLASGQIVMRKVDGWETLAEPLAATSTDLLAA